MNRLLLSPVLLLLSLQLTAQTELAVFNFESGLADSLQFADTKANEVQSCVANYQNITLTPFNTLTFMGPGCTSGPNNTQAYGQPKWNYASPSSSRNAGRFFFITLNLKPSSPDVLVSSIEFDYRVGPGGPTRAAIEYSIDGGPFILLPTQDLGPAANTCYNFVEDLSL